MASFLRDAEFGQNVLHQTPLRERRLQEIQSDKGGEEQPVPAVDPG
jgi:hypothetical protein